MDDFEIWMEGYRATGEDVKAVIIGVFPGETFDDAVEEFLTRRPNLKSMYKMTERYLQRDKEGVMQKVKTHQIWACGLYDNETDARKANG